MTDNNDIGWMYEGAKSLVNREDYLLGKKVDKNFEKYSDAVNEQKVEALEALLHTRTVVRPLPGAVKTSALESYVVAKEDPLVAVKVKEETRRREVLENPLVKLKFQKMLKEMMAEKESRGGKKDKKKKKKKKKRNGEEHEEHMKEKKIRKKSRESEERSRKISPKRKSSQREASSDSSESEAERKPRSEKCCGETQTRRQGSRSPQKHRLNNARRSRSPTTKGKRRRSRSPSAEGKNRRNDSERRSERQDHHRRNQRSPARENRGSDRSPAHSKVRSRDAESPRDGHRRGRSRSRSRRSASREQRRGGRSPRRRSGERSSRAVPFPSRGKTKTDACPRKRSASSSAEGSSSTSSSSSSEDACKALDRKESKGSKNAFTDSSRVITRNPERDSERHSEKPGSSKEIRMEADKIRSYDSHIPEHLRPKAATTESDEESEDMFDREERERKKRFEGFGLVGVKKKVDDDAPSQNPYELSRKPAVPVYKKSDRRQPLTEEEKQRKLQEMAENARWRQDTRIQNLKRSHLDEEKEVEQDMNDKAPSFIRSQLNSAANDLTVEQRLQSKKKSLQRSHGYMEKKFMSK